MTRHFLAGAALLLATAAAPFDPVGAARIDERPGAHVPMSGDLIDENGAHTTLARLGRGRPMLLVPVLHDCPNLCGVTLDGLASAMRAGGVVGDRDAAVVAFGIDPKESVGDARVAIDKLVLRHPELAGRVHATVGAGATDRAVTDALGYHYAFDPRIGQIAHAAAVAVVTPDGRFSRWIYGLAPEPADVTTALTEARAGHTGGFVRQLILLCYHYDPATGRYGLAIAWLLRVACLVTILAVLFYVALSKRREGQSGC